MDAGEDKAGSLAGPDVFRYDAVLIVADQDRLKQLSGQVDQSALTGGDRVAELIFSGDVYEAAAVVAERCRLGGTLLVCVMVDYLRSQEMRIFASGVRISQVRTAAFSAFGNHEKLIQAQSLGADEIFIGLDQLQRHLEVILTERSQPRPANVESASFEVCKVEPQRRVRQIVDPIITEITNRDIASAKNTAENSLSHRQEPRETQRMPKKPASRSSDEPLLSREELDALLGNGN